MTVLWRVPLQILDITTHQSKHLYQVNGKENAIKFLHTAEFSPVQDTREKSVNRGYFNTWPGLTAKYINKMSKDEATIKGHIVQSRKKPVQQQPKISMDKNRLTQIQYKNQITARQSS